MVWLASPTAEVVAVAEPEFEESLLEGADVLVFVDHEVLVLGADLFGNVVAVLEDADGEQEYVFEVDEGAVALERFVGRVDLGGLGVVAGGEASGFGGCCGVVGGDGLGDFGPLDFGRDVAELAALEADAAGGGRVGDELDLAVDDARQLAADCFGPEELELAQGRGVEGAGLDSAGAEVAEASAHFACCAVGEGDGEDAVGLEDARADAVGDAVGDGAGLACARAGEDAHRSVQGGGDGALFGVEPVEHRVGRVRNLREEGGVRCCCHPAMLPGRWGRVRRVVHRRRVQSY